MEVSLDLTQEQVKDMIGPFQTDLLYLFREMLADMMETLDEDIDEETFVRRIEDMLSDRT